MQITNHETTKAGSKLIVVDDASKDPCSSALLLQQHRPLRFRVLGDTEYLSCGWKSKNEAIRMGLCIGSMFFVALGLFGLIKERKWAMWVFTLCSFLLAFAFFCVMCLDSNDVRVSSSWCSKGLTGLQTSTSVKCGYFPFILTCLMDAASFAIWVITVVFAFKYARHHMNAPPAAFVYEDEQRSGLLSEEKEKE